MKLRNKKFIVNQPRMRTTVWFVALYTYVMRSATLCVTGDSVLEFHRKLERSHYKALIPMPLLTAFARQHKRNRAGILN